MKELKRSYKRRGDELNTYGRVKAAELGMEDVPRLVKEWRKEMREKKSNQSSR